MVTTDNLQLRRRILHRAYIEAIFMVNVTVDEMQGDPAKYLRLVEAGESFVILQAGKPIAELKPIASNKRLLQTQVVQQSIEELRPIPSGKQLRPFGLCAGEFTVPSDFDAPLPEDILSAFEGR